MMTLDNLFSLFDGIMTFVSGVWPVAILRVGTLTLTFGGIITLMAMAKIFSMLMMIFSRRS